MNITQKKEWLGRYAYYYDLCKDRHDQRDAILNISASRLSLTPKSKNDGSGMERMILDRSEIESELNYYLGKLRETHSEITAALNQLKDPREARVLRLKYLNLKGWPEIAEMMDLSRSSVYMVFNKALKHLKIK